MKTSVFATALVALFLAVSAVAGPNGFTACAPVEGTYAKTAAPFGFPNEITISESDLLPGMWFVETGDGLWIMEVKGDHLVPFGTGDEIVPDDQLIVTFDSWDGSPENNVPPQTVATMGINRQSGSYKKK